MDVRILHMVEGAKAARGLTVVIDVFRAFSLACYIFDKGANEILSVGDINIAYQLKNENPDYILIGERNERIPEGFDFGNSPTHILCSDFSNKTIVHTTSAGTQGLVNAHGAAEILTGSFVNAPAIVKYIRHVNPDVVSLVCMGYSAMRQTEEDNLCAEYIHDSLMGKTVDYPAMVEIIKFTSGRRLFDAANQGHSPESDFYLCTDLGKFNFVLKAEPVNDKMVRLKRLDAGYWCKG